MKLYAFARRVALVGLLCGVFAPVALADFGKPVEGLARASGLMETYVDAARARVLVALDKPDAQGINGRYIYAAYLTAGLGSNPVGLDRSVPSDSQIIQFRQMGDKMVAMIENTAFTASGTAAEKGAVATSFAQSIIWSTPIVAVEEGTGRVLIDLSDFLKRDGVGVAARLEETGQGSYTLDQARSFVKTDAAHVFPLNLEFDAYVTFQGKKPGREIRATTPAPEAVTLIAHTSLMQLPAPGYQARQNDERAGIIGMNRIDMSAPLTGDVVERLARRFRLELGADGTVVKPIVFYIDNAAPEPIRSALLDGANWWAAAFDAAGYKGGYRAEILPDGAHPLDARYNVVNWVHRATRGWSYGAALHDPRTGETLRGIVLLGSLRVRQDIRIFEALAGAGKTGTGAADDPVELALARIRQLAAHEIGHALGFEHNMAASTYGGGASVMDYPAPDVTARADGSLDFSHAYGTGLGAWDHWTVEFLYGDYQGKPDAAAQAERLAAARRDGLVYVSDGDSRAVGSGHAAGALWDTGADAVASLANTLAVRRRALDRFGEGNLRKGESFTALQTKFVPLYLYHRYQVQAAAKRVGGLEYMYRHEGDGRPAPVIVPGDRQQAALAALLGTLSPATLDVQDSVLNALSPLGEGEGDPQFKRESFKNQAGPMFDHLSAARVAADLSFEALLNPRRLLRVDEQALQGLGLQGLLGQTSAQVMDGLTTGGARHQRLGQIVADVYLDHLISLTFEADTPLTVRTAARGAMMDLAKSLGRVKRTDRPAAQGLIDRIEDAVARGRTPVVKAPTGPDVPHGSPIGASDASDCWFCEADGLQ